MKTSVTRILAILMWSAIFLGVGVYWLQTYTEQICVTVVGSPFCYQPIVAPHYDSRFIVLTIAWLCGVFVIFVSWYIANNVSDNIKREVT
jgi:hypothetical protein